MTWSAATLAQKAICCSAQESAAVTTDSDSSPNGLVHLTTGYPITEVVKIRDQKTGEIISTEYWFVNEDTGVLEMTNNAQQVGHNAPPVLNQLLGEIKLEYFDPAADITKTAADLLDDAIADGLMVRTYKADGTLFERVATPDDTIVKVDFDLKPVWGGAGALEETEGQATTSEAAIIDGVDEQNMDGGGSRTYGSLVSGATNLMIPPEFNTSGEMQLKAGSVMEVTLVVASIPTPESELV